MPKKTRDHKPFLEAVAGLKKRVGRQKKFLSVGLTDTEALAILDHAKWFAGWLASKKVASHARTKFGPERKPDAEVSPNALRMRKVRDEAKNKS